MQQELRNKVAALNIASSREAGVEPDSEANLMSFQRHSVMQEAWHTWCSAGWDEPANTFRAQIG
jgi:hypothetical protein